MGRRRTKNPPASTVPTPVWRSTFVLSLIGGALLWAAFAPLQWAWLAWFAPVPWVFMIRAKRLAGRRPYRAMWFASLIFWLAILQGVTRAHPLNYIGWVALAMYLAVYLPGFVALTRVAVLRFRIPVMLAAPVVWTGLELLRGRLFTGFSFCLLAHTQVNWPQVIQISDLCGAYGVSFVVMLVAASLARMLRTDLESSIDPSARVIWPLIPLVVALAATLGYGHLRMAVVPLGHDGAAIRTSNSDTTDEDVAASLRVALIQRVIDTKFESDPGRNVDTFDQYWKSTLQAREDHPQLDLIIWPESVFSENNPEVQCDDDFFLPPDVPLERDEFFSRFQDRQRIFQEKLQSVGTGVNRVWRDGAFETLDIYLLVGTETIRFGADRLHMHNSALLINPAGEIVDRYYKMHPVMFGEYIPLGRWIPLIYDLAPMSQGITPGRKPEAFQLGGMTLAPSICFESSVPHLIRRQVVELSRQGTSPDILINITHDGWFFGSSILEHQFAGTVFRAVELRRPVLVAANAGISCWIDGSGTVRARGPRRGNDVVIAQVEADGRWSGYEAWGDLPAAFCLVACVLLLLASGVAVIRRRIPAAAVVEGAECVSGPGRNVPTVTDV